MTDLFSLMTPPPGMHFVRGLGCTYSADDFGIDQMAGALGVCLDSAAYRNFLEGQTFRLYVQHGEGPETPHQFIVSKKPETGCLHAKLYLLQYQNATDAKEPQTLLRCIVSSGNLVHNDELNVYFRAEGTPVENTFSVFGTCLSAFLRQLEDSIPENLQALLQLAECSDFQETPDISFSPADKDLLNTMKAEAASAKRILVISPFLHNDVLDDLLPAGADRTLVSRPDQLNSVFAASPSTLNGVTCQILQDSSASTDASEEPDDADDLLLNCLHAKFYAFQKEHETIVYLGSANATHAAFYKNIEVLVRYTTSEDIILNIKKMFAVYLPHAPKPVEKARKKFEENCLKIRNSWEDSRYGVDAATIPNGYTLRLDHVPLTNADGTWQRTNHYIHTAVLTISATINNEEFQSSSYLQITGDAREIDNATLKQCQDAALYQRWKRALSSGRTNASATRKKSSLSKDRLPSFTPATMENLLTTCIQNAAKDPTADHCSKLAAALDADLAQADDNLRLVLKSARTALDACMKEGDLT